MKGHRGGGGLWRQKWAVSRRWLEVLAGILIQVARFNGAASRVDAIWKQKWMYSSALRQKGADFYTGRELAPCYYSSYNSLSSLPSLSHCSHFSALIMYLPCSIAEVPCCVLLTRWFRIGLNNEWVAVVLVLVCFLSGVSAGCHPVCQVAHC